MAAVALKTRILKIIIIFFNFPRFKCYKAYYKVIPF